MCKLCHVDTGKGAWPGTALPSISLLKKQTKEWTAVLVLEPLLPDEGKILSHPSNTYTGTEMQNARVTFQLEHAGLPQAVMELNILYKSV